MLALARAAAAAHAGALARGAARSSRRRSQSVYVDPALISWVVDLATATRKPAEHGVAGDRAVHLVRREPARADQRVAAARALALLRGRDYVLAGRRRGAPPRRLPAPPRPLVPGARRGGHRRHGARRRPRGGRSASDRLRSNGPARPERGGGGSGVRPPQSPLEAHRPRAHARGPGPASHAESLRALELSIGRRVDGLLAGDYRSAFAGLGSELFQVRPYEAGDDVRRIDWNVTARTGQTHVRVELAERVLVTWLVLDSSASMTFGTADRRKADVAEGVALAVGHAATPARQPARARRVRAGGPELAPPAAGPPRLLLTLAALRDEPVGRRRARRGAARSSTGSRSSARSSSIVSDFRGPIDWRKPLLRVAGRHPTVAVEIRDPREQELADVGELRLVDPETGRQLRVDTSDRRPPRALRRGRGRGAPEPRAAARRRPASGTSRSRPRATGCAPLAAFLRRSARRVSFAVAGPAARALLVVPLAIVGLRRARAAAASAARRRWTTPALVPNMSERARRAGSGTSRRSSSCSASCCSSSASRGPKAKLTPGREGATVVLAIDVSGSMAAKDVQPTAARRGRGRCRRSSLNDLPKPVPGLARHVLRTTRPSSSRRPTTARRDGGRDARRRPSHGTALGDGVERGDQGRAQGGRVEASRASRIRRSRPAPLRRHPERRPAHPPGGRRRGAQGRHPDLDRLARDAPARSSYTPLRRREQPSRTQVPVDPTRPAGARRGDRGHVLRRGVPR